MKKTVTITATLTLAIVGGFLLSQAASAVGIYDACSTDPNNIVVLTVVNQLILSSKQSSDIC